MKFFPEKPENQERFFDGIKAILVAVLITTGGTIVSSVNNYYSNKLAQQKQVLADSRKAATDVATDLIDKLDCRKYYAVRVAVAFNWGFDQSARYNEYDKAVQEWNNKLTSRLIAIKRYFGTDTEKEVFGLIKDFSAIHDLIMQNKNLYEHKQPPIELNKLLNLTYAMDDKISNFGDKLQTQLREGKVDIYTASPPVSKPMGVEVKH